MKTTHMGSLPRPRRLMQMLMTKQRGEQVDPALFEECQRGAVFQAVQMQVDLGIFAVSNGEMNRPDFMSYMAERLDGFAFVEAEAPWIVSDLDAEEAERQFSGTSIRLPSCTGAISYRGEQCIQHDIATFKASLKAAGHSGEAFMTAPSPGVLALDLADRYYHDESAYLRALAAALREDYQAIVQEGLLLQVDCPDLALARNVAKYGAWSSDGQPLYRTEQEYQRFVDLAISALNDALAGLPAEAVRIHACNGNHLGTHHHDVHLHDLIPLLSRLHCCGTWCVEGANPQHLLDYLALTDVSLPENIALVIGVIDTKTSTVEPKELVALRLQQVAELIGAERTVAGTDCGFATFGGSGYAHLAPSAVPLKLKSLSEGAALAARPGGDPGLHLR